MRCSIQTLFVIGHKEVKAFLVNFCLRFKRKFTMIDSRFLLREKKVMYGFIIHVSVNTMKESIFKVSSSRYNICLLDFFFFFFFQAFL